jgi:hypothetical protein
MLMRGPIPLQRAHWILRAVAALLVAALLAPAIALADADPASDVLLGTSVFYPYAPPVSAATQKRLNAEAAAAVRAHFPIKVAIIGTPTDLGAVPNLFGKPQQYADFLDQEISFNSKQPLLVVMPQGYGTAGLPSAATQAARSLPSPGHGGEQLAQSSLAALPKLAGAAGHPIANVTPTSRGGSGGSSPALLVAIIAVVAIALTAAVIASRRRAGTR